MLVLVAGGAGLLGFAAARRLLDDGHSVLAADVFGDSGDGRAVTRERAAELKAHPRASVAVADLTDPLVVEALFAEHRPAAVVNAARFDPAGPGGHALRTFAVSAGTGLYIHLSSGALYAPAPSEEGAAAPPHAREDERVDPGDDSGLNAQADEESHTAASGLPYVILRVFDPIAPAMPVSRFPMEALEAILAEEEVFLTGESPRDFVHVEDVARGVALALRKRPLGRTINLGSGSATSPRWILEALAGKAGKPLRLTLLPPPAGAPRPPRIADLEGAWTHLGYSPQHAIEDTLEQIVAARLGRPAPVRPAPETAGSRAPEPPRDVSRRELFDMFRRPFSRDRR
jgi:nucleoside-diphosphate-sugar epimerase